MKMETEVYEHHGNIVHVNKKMKGKHRDICLCYARCAKFHPGEANHCPIAQAVYQNCVDFKLVTPVLECPEYEATPEA